MRIMALQLQAESYTHVAIYCHWQRMPQALAMLATLVALFKRCSAAIILRLHL